MIYLLDINHQGWNMIDTAPHLLDQGVGLLYAIELLYHPSLIAKHGGTVKLIKPRDFDRLEADDLLCCSYSEELATQLHALKPGDLCEQWRELKKKGVNLLLVQPSSETWQQLLGAKSCISVLGQGEAVKTKEGHSLGYYRSLPFQCVAGLAEADAIGTIGEQSLGYQNGGVTALSIDFFKWFMTQINNFEPTIRPMLSQFFINLIPNMPDASFACPSGQWEDWMNFQSLAYGQQQLEDLFGESETLKTIDQLIVSLGKSVAQGACFGDQDFIEIAKKMQELRESHGQTRFFFNDMLHGGTLLKTTGSWELEWPELTKKMINTWLDWCDRYRYQFTLDVNAVSLESFQIKYPTTCKRLMAAWADEKAEVIACGYSQPLAGFIDLESSLRQLDYGMEILNKMAPQNVRLFGTQEFSVTPQFPAQLAGYGIDKVVIRFQNSSKAPVEKEALISWEGADGTTLIGLPDEPSKAIFEGTIFYFSLKKKIAYHLNHGSDDAVLVCQMDLSHLDFREEFVRLHQWAPVFGEIKTVSQIFSKLEDRLLITKQYKIGEFEYKPWRPWQVYTAIPTHRMIATVAQHARALEILQATLGLQTSYPEKLWKHVCVLQDHGMLLVPYDTPGSFYKGISPYVGPFDSDDFWMHLQKLRKPLDDYTKMEIGLNVLYSAVSLDDEVGYVKQPTQQFNFLENKSAKSICVLKDNFLYNPTERPRTVLLTLNGQKGYGSFKAFSGRTVLDTQAMWNAACSEKAQVHITENYAKLSNTNQQLFVDLKTGLITSIVKNNQQQLGIQGMALCRNADDRLTMQSYGEIPVENGAGFQWAFDLESASGAFLGRFVVCCYLADQGTRFDFSVIASSLKPCLKRDIFDDGYFLRIHPSEDKLTFHQCYQNVTEPVMKQEYFSQFGSKITGLEGKCNLTHLHDGSPFYLFKEANLYHCMVHRLMQQKDFYFAIELGDKSIITSSLDWQTGIFTLGDEIDSLFESIDCEDVILTSITLTKEGCYRIRGADVSGAASQLKLTLATIPKSVVRQMFDGHAKESIDMKGRMLELKLSAFEIFQVEIQL